MYQRKVFPFNPSPGPSPVDSRLSTPVPRGWEGGPVTRRDRIVFFFGGGPWDKWSILTYGGSVGYWDTWEIGGLPILLKKAMTC